MSSAQHDPINQKPPSTSTSFSLTHTLPSGLHSIDLLPFLFLETCINRRCWWRCRRPDTIMTTEFLRVKKFHHQEADTLSLRKRMELQPELSLAPAAWPGFAAPTPAAKSSSSESDGTSRKKRKHYYHAGAGAGWKEPQQPPASLELQLNDPLPLDWEQCLDLQSGRMYYLNRKTLKKSWVRPREQSVNLDLNISTAAIVDTSASEDAEPTKRPAGAVSSGSNNMVAVPCANCHLLVMLCKSSPSCPNCKFVQPLAPATSRAAVPQPAHRRLDAAVKPLETLSLLH